LQDPYTAVYHNGYDGIRRFTTFAAAKNNLPTPAACAPLACCNMFKDIFPEVYVSCLILSITSLFPNHKNLIIHTMPS
jgi:hypothetical protein